MKLTVFVEPHAGSFRATSGNPLPLTADGPTAAAAVAALRAEFAARLQAGGQVFTLTVTTPANVIAAAHAVGDNPLFQEYLVALEEYHREHNTIPDAA